MRLAAPAVSVVLLASALAWPAAGETPASEVVYFEPGLRPANGFTDPEAALRPALGPADPRRIVSLGAWSDDPETGANDGRPPGIVLSWPFPVPDELGADLRIVGNNFGGFHEPGMVEVAAETTGGPGTWQDETFYLIRPGNYASLPADPRTAPAPITLLTDGTGLYAEPHWQTPLTGYADTTPGGDLIDISDAIDLQGNPVSLGSVTYIRIRSVSDSSAGAFGQISTEIDTVTALHGLAAPLPAPALAPGWSATPVQASPEGWVIEALTIDPADGALLATESDYTGRSATRILRAGTELRRIEPYVFVSFITPTRVGYTDFVDGGGIEPLLGGGRLNILQTFDLAGDLLSHNPVLFGSGTPANRISHLAADGTLTPVIETGGFSGPLVTTGSGHIWYAEPGGSLYRFAPTEETPLTLADADQTLALSLNALANGPGETLLAHDFATLRSVDPATGTTVEIATTPLAFGPTEMWAGEVYTTVTDYGVNRSVIYRLTPESTPRIVPTSTGAVATFLPGTTAVIETFGPGRTWIPAPATTTTDRDARRLTATSSASVALFRLRYTAP